MLFKDKGATYPWFARSFVRSFVPSSLYALVRPVCPLSSGIDAPFNIPSIYRSILVSKRFQ